MGIRLHRGAAASAASEGAGTALPARREATGSSGRAPADPRVAVMILNWNAGPHLLRCVESVRRTVPPTARVVVIDNASHDDSLESIGHIQGIELTRNEANLGFAAAYNRALFSATEEFVVLLNPDIVAERPGWLEELLERAAAEPRQAAVACRLLFAHDPRTLNSAGGMVYWWTGPVDLGFGEDDVEAHLRELRPFAPCGGAMLVRSVAFREAGGFDEAMFAFVEDVDLGWRLRLVGWDIGYAPNARLLHAFAATTGAISPLRVYLTHRNFLRAMLKNYSRRTLLRALPAYALWTAAKSAGSLVLERSPTLAAAPLRALGWNVLRLGETLRARRAVQASRLVGDAEILQSMGPRGFEPLASLQRRRRIAHLHPKEARP